MDWSVRTLLLSAVFCVVFCDDHYTEIGKEVIASSNQFLRENNLTEVELEEFSISPFDFEGGRLGQLDTLEFVNVPVSLYDPKEYGVIYYFFTMIKMKKLILNYQYVMPPFINRNVKFSIDVGNNSFYAGVNAFIGKDGSCSADLEKAYVYKLMNYEVKIDPRDIRVPFIRQLYENIINKMVYNRVPSLVNHIIQRQIFAENFRKVFNDIVCSVMNKSASSDTEQNSLIEPRK